MSKKKTAILTAFCIVFICMAGYSIYRVFTIESGYLQGRKDYSEISADYLTVDDPKTNAVSQRLDGDYSPIHVNFEELREKVNPEICAWIWCPGTIIDYPVVQHSDNEFYLNHGANLSENPSGAIFIDSANFNDFSDRNTIIHGHHMGDGSMFASLPKWYSEEYWEEHPVIYLNTAENGNYKIEIFAVMEVPAGSEPYRFEFESKNSIENWLSWLNDNSVIHPEVDVNPEDRFITLSTCAYSFENARTVVVGRSILVDNLVKNNLKLSKNPFD